MRRLLSTLFRRSVHSKALLFLFLIFGILVLPRTASAQQDIVDDETFDVSDFCDFGFFCELESVAVIFDTTTPSHLDVLSETDVNLDALDDGWAAYDCGTVLEDGTDLADGCADDDGSGSASLSGSIPISAQTGTFLYTVFTDSFLADVFNDDFACDDGDPDFCFEITVTAVQVVIGPISINSVFPTLITVGTNGTLAITGQNLVNPFGGPQPDVQTHLVGGVGSGFTISSPDFTPDGLGGTVSYQADPNAIVGKWSIGISYVMGGTFRTSTNEGGLTVGFPPAFVSNATPNPLLAGQSNVQLTITGQNFGPNPTLTLSGTGVTLINFTPNPNGQSIVATVNVDLNAPNGSALIDVAPGYSQPFICACTGSGHGISSVNVQAAIAPPPQIIFNGNNVAGTTQNVSAGQRIALTGIPPAGFTVVSGSWFTTDGFNMVGGYGDGSGGPPGPKGGHVVPTPSTNCPGNCNFTYYYQGAPGVARMTLNYNLVNGTTSSATVDFNLNGPSGVILPNTSLQLDNTSVVITNTNNGSAEMHMGNAPGSGVNGGNSPDIGVVITSNVAFTQGNLIWVQIKQSSTLTTIWDPSFGFNPPPNTGVGLDGGFPYPPRDNKSASDAPGRSLSSSMGEGSKTFDAIMYVMWDPAIPGPGQTSCTTAHVNTGTAPYTYIASTCASIPVPLGLVRYKWSGCAINHGAGPNPNWAVQCGAATSLPPEPAGFPEWSACISSANADCRPPTIQ